MTGIDAFAAFAGALQRREVLAISGDAFTLPEGVVWPDLKSPVLHMRDFFEDFVEGALSGFDRKKAGYDIYIVCGTAGLGKSAFGAWLCAYAVLQGRTVVYQVINQDDVAD